MITLSILHASIQYEIIFSPKHNDNKYELLHNRLLFDIFEQDTTNSLNNNSTSNGVRSKHFVYTPLQGIEKTFPVILPPFELDSQQKRQPRILSDVIHPTEEAGKPSIVSTMQEFMQHFNEFTSNQLRYINWNNIMVAGGSILSCLMKKPVRLGKPSSNNKMTSTLSKPESYSSYYQDDVWSNSDIDLFLIGLTKETAEKKV